MVDSKARKGSHQLQASDRPSLFLRCIAWLLMLTLSTSSFAQAVGPIARGSYGQLYTGFTKNGTLVQGGQVVGKPAIPSSLIEIVVEVVVSMP